MLPTIANVREARLGKAVRRQYLENTAANGDEEHAEAVARTTIELGRNHRRMGTKLFRYAEAHAALLAVSTHRDFGPARWRITSPFASSLRRILPMVWTW